MFSIAFFSSRKQDGKISDFKAGVEGKKSLPFPYPRASVHYSPDRALHGDEFHGAAGGDSIHTNTRSKSEYEREIAGLQAMLHSATAQIEQRNLELVKVENVNSQLTGDLKDQAKSLNKLRNENFRLSRELDSVDGVLGRPRPGPAYKAWESLKTMI